MWGLEADNGRTAARRESNRVAGGRFMSLISKSSSLLRNSTRNARQGRLRLLGQHRTLLEALKDDERLKLVGAGTSWYEAGSEIDMQLAENLQNDFPDAAAMLLKERPDPDPQNVRVAFEQFQRQLRAHATQGGQQTGVHAAVIATPQTSCRADEFYSALVKLLSKEKTSGRDRAPGLLVC